MAERGGTDGPTISLRAFARAASSVRVALLTGLLLLVSAAVSRAACVGDCNASGAVTVDELITGVNIALGSLGLAECTAFESKTDGVVTIDELLAGVNNALAGCAERSPTLTPPVSSPTSIVTPPPLVTPTSTETTPHTPTVEPTVPGTIPAPPVTPGVATNTFDAGRFLYEGAGAPQKGVAPDTIDPVRASIVRGRVLDREGHGLGGVTVDVLDHPEYGSTQSVGDGGYALAVNGGGKLTLRFAKAGLIGAQRDVDPSFADWEVIEDVGLIPYDSMATMIDFSGNMTSWQTHRSSIQTDEDGTRRVTLLIPPATTASMVLPNGSSQALTQGTVRVTEFTVGDMGPTAMPAILPATSAYTYAAEFSIDEAVALETTQIAFNHPVVAYLDEFIGFPVGAPVPLGFYDVTRGVWCASENGIVLKIVGITDGKAELDLDSEWMGGDGGADPERYSALNIADGEREALAELFAPGAKAQRLVLPRFSKWDPNYGQRLPPAARGARRAGRPPASDGGGGSNGGYGTVRIEEQIFDEDIGLVGVPFGLHYTSRRQVGRVAEREIQLPITDAEPPEPLLEVVTELEVAGNLSTQRWPNTANQTVTLAWDGADGFGRSVTGRQPGRVRIGYVYQPIYAPGQRFGVPAEVELTTTEARQTFTWWTEEQITLGEVSTDAAGLGGWTPTIWHTYDPVGRAIHLGNGTVRSTRTLSPVMTSEQSDVAGEVEGVDAAPDGSVYFLINPLGPVTQQIRRINPDGSVDLVAGGGSDADTDDGGVAALQARINSGGGFAVGADGAVYFSEDERIRKLKDGRIETIAGKHNTDCASHTDPCGDNGPALAARFEGVKGIDIAPDGSIVVADTAAYRVRRIDPGGTVNTILGTGVQGDALPELPATARQTAIGSPYNVAVANDGTVYVKTGSTYAAILGVGIDGIARHIAGRTTSGGFYKEGELATEAQINQSADEIVVGPDDRLYIAVSTGNTTRRIRRIDADGRIRTVAVKGTAGTAGDGGPALAAEIGSNAHRGIHFAIDSNGQIVIDDSGNERIRRVSPAFPGYTAEGIRIPSADASEVYLFDRNGRHLSTRDALTGATIWTFNYDGQGRLISIADREGDLTTIGRDASGRATNITSPDGDRTTLAYSTSGDLSSVTNPANETVQLEYAPGRLLSAITGPRGNRYSFQYDAKGRFIRTDDPPPTGGSLALERTETASGRTVTETTALGRVTTHALETLEDGSSRRRVTGSNGLTTETIERPDDSTLTTFPDGTSIETVLGPDPRFAMMAPLEIRTAIDLPGLPARLTTRERTAALSDPADPFSLRTLTESETTGGRTRRFHYDAVGRTLTATSAAGRVGRTVRDPRGRLASVERPGSSAVRYTYDDRGRVVVVAQGIGESERRSLNVYGTTGRLERVVDPLGNEVTFVYDEARRVVTVSRPEGGSIGFSYFAGGQLSSVTPPQRGAHNLGYSPVDLVDSYTPPPIPGGASANDAATTTYDADRRSIGAGLPGGARTVSTYDEQGRFSSLTIPGGAYTYGYTEGSPHLTSIDAPAGGGTLTFALDGFLPTRELWNGAVDGSVERAYDANLQAVSHSVNGSHTASYGFDDDFLVTSLSGAVTASITREPATGRIGRLDCGDLREELTYDGQFGELARRVVKRISSSEILYDMTIERDRLGRVTAREEAVLGATTTTTFTYDRNGRLIAVNETGEANNSYEFEYDRNGNRVRGPVDEVYLYDEQDRLVSSTVQGGKTYAYSPDGRLSSVSSGSGNTALTYDVLGNLRSLTLPDGGVVSYRVDGVGNRIERQAGPDVRRWLYDRRGRVIAELDDANAVRSRFVYATLAYTPDIVVHDGQTYRIVADHTGSVRLVLRVQDGTPVQRIDYDPFGFVKSDSSPGFQPYGFAGGIYDPATGFVRFGLRDYDPRVGRFTAKDPIGFAGGYGNLYAYAGNDPVNRADPSGLGPQGSSGSGPSPAPDGTLIFDIPANGPDPVTIQNIHNHHVNQIRVAQNIRDDIRNNAGYLTLGVVAGGAAFGGGGQVGVGIAVNPVTGGVRPWIKGGLGAGAGFGGGVAVEAGVTQGSSLSSITGASPEFGFAAGAGPGGGVSFPVSNAGASTNSFSISGGAVVGVDASFHEVGTWAPDVGADQGFIPVP